MTLPTASLAALSSDYQSSDSQYRNFLAISLCYLLCTHFFNEEVELVVNRACGNSESSAEV
jgi:hypothetical protein